MTKHLNVHKVALLLSKRDIEITELDALLDEAVAELEQWNQEYGNRGSLVAHKLRKLRSKRE